MEFKFLDSKLPIALTNLIASYVGPKNNEFVKEIQQKYKKGINKDFMTCNYNYSLWDIKFALKHIFIDVDENSRLKDIHIELDNYFNNDDEYDMSDEIYLIMKFQSRLLKMTEPTK